MSAYPNGAVQRFDPLQPSGPAHRAAHSLLAASRVRRLCFSFAHHEERLVTGIITGPLGPLLPIPLAVITTAGGRTGLPRKAPVTYFTDGDDVILIGSNFGAAKTPGWAHNLKVNPELTVERGSVRAGYHASPVAAPDERKRLLGLAERAHPGFSAYLRDSAATGTGVPVFRLRFTGFSSDGRAAGIPQFEPRSDHGPAYRILERFMRTPVARKLGIRLVSKVDPVLLRWSGGRVGICLLMPTAAVFYFTDGPDVILVASNFGQSRHPAWYHNLSANPRAEMERGGRSGTYTATAVSDPAEHERLLELASRVFSGYLDYQRMTAAVDRRIPILRLKLDTDG